MGTGLEKAVISVCQAWSRLPHPKAPFLKHSHTALLICRVVDCLCWEAAARRGNVKVISPRCSAHSRCFKILTECYCRYELQHTFSHFVFKQPGKLFCVRLQSEWWGSESTDVTGCGHLTIIVVFHFLGSRHYPGPQPAFLSPPPQTE